MSSTLGDYSKRIREIASRSPEKVEIDTHHIEKERRYREIVAADVRKVLRIGKAVEVREEGTIVFQGPTQDGKTIKLFCSLQDEDGEETLIVKDAESIEVATAFEAGVDDKKLKANWLKQNPEYEDAGRNGVQKKIAHF